jgi:murein DD-endopeptidase MepM/ murein hydrolase activator NlpD
VIALLLASSAFAQDYAFPTTASDYGYWYPTSYFDHGGGTDYTCNGDAYGGHNGSDYGAGSWAGMNAGRSVTAAAAGTVTYVHDGEVDTCTGNCSSPANVVQIQHPNGLVTVYAHLKRWSIPVQPGDSVACGQVIGEMGSSGFSSGPHLHFGVYSGQTALDPFEGSCNPSPSMWVSQGGYQGVPARTCDNTSGGGGGGGCGALTSGHIATALFLLPLGLFRRRQDA